MSETLFGIPAAFYAPGKKRLGLLGYVFLCVLCIGFFTPGIATMPPTDRDESSFAQASKQMIESGDYVDIRLQDKPRYQKPIGIYWLQSAAARMLNPHHLNQIWAYRVPSFLGATTAVLLTAAIGDLLFGPAAGLLAAVMLAGCVLLNVEARLAKTDAMLLACVVAAQYTLARAYLRQASGWAMPLLFWTAMAGGILIKGPIILLPVLGTLLWLRIADGTISWLRALRPGIGIVYMLALVSPWFIAITMQSHGAFIEKSAGHDMLAKIWQGQNRGIMPPGLHLMALPIAFFPFSLFVILAAPDAWKNRHDDKVKFCLGWLIPAWIVFELSLTKLPHYVLPTYPALALMAGKFVQDGLPTISTTTRRLPVALIIGLWIFIGAGFAVLFSVLPYLSDGAFGAPQIVAGAILMLTQGAALMFMLRDKPASIAVMAAGALIFMSVTFGDTLPDLRHIWLSREIVDAAGSLAGQSGQCATHEHRQIVAAGYHEPSLAFLGGTDTIMAPDGAAAARALQQDSCRIAVITAKNIPAFLSAFPDSAPRPVAVRTITGLNSGHGGAATLTLYRMPPS